MAACLEVLLLPLPISPLSPQRASPTADGGKPAPKPRWPAVPQSWDAAAGASLGRTLSGSSLALMAQVRGAAAGNGQLWLFPALPCAAHFECLALWLSASRLPAPKRPPWPSPPTHPPPAFCPQDMLRELERGAPAAGCRQALGAQSLSRLATGLTAFVLAVFFARVVML